jgi:hypothetical protein
MNRAVLQGDRPGALDAVQSELEVDGPTQLPEKLDSVKVLLLLERASLLQATAQYKDSTRSFQAADDSLEVLDLSGDVAGSIGKFLFSDDSKLYVAPPYEKQLVNALNLLNYLALGDLEGARVEARRLDVLRDMLLEEAGEQGAVSGLASYLAGFAFEMSGRPGEALRYYAEALTRGTFPSLAPALRRLAAQDSYRAPSIEGLLTEAPQPQAEGTGTVLVVYALGRAPHREPEHIPIGVALALVGNARGNAAITAEQRAQADMLVARGLLTWLNLPRLAATPYRYAGGEVRAQGIEVPAELAQDVEAAAASWFEEIRPTIVASALTRAITRLLLSVAAEGATKAAGGNSGLGALLGLALQGALLAADTPDTRSWNNLAARYAVSRLELPAGEHTLGIHLEGPQGTGRVERSVVVRAGGFAVVPVVLMY